MYGDKIIQEYKGFEALDRSSYIHFENYIKAYLTAEMG
jgi:hypothetical protein